MQVDANDSNVCMMEGCSEADLLPAKCGKCQRRFCTKHLSYNDHHCDRNFEAQVVSCPVCGASIACPVGQDPNLIISKHIDNGCRVQETRDVERSFPTHEQLVRGVKPSERHNYCSFTGCNKNELVLLICEKCGQSFCVSHRTPSKHDCPARTPPPQSAIPHRSPSVSPSKKSSSAPRNTRDTPIGSYKGEEGMVCLVYLDLSKPNGTTPPLSSTSYYFKLSKVAVVGRAIDQYCAAVDVLSANVTEQWYFFNVSRGCVRMEANVAAGSVAADGEVLLCSRDAELRPEVLQAIQSAQQQRNANGKGKSATSGGNASGGCTTM